MLPNPVDATSPIWAGEVPRGEDLRTWKIIKKERRRKRSPDLPIFFSSSLQPLELSPSFCLAHSGKSLSQLSNFLPWQNSLWHCWCCPAPIERRDWVWVCEQLPCISSGFWLTAILVHTCHWRPRKTLSQPCSLSPVISLFLAKFPVFVFVVRWDNFHHQVHHSKCYQQSGSCTGIQTDCCYFGNAPSGDSWSHRLLSKVYKIIHLKWKNLTWESIAVALLIRRL